MQANRIMRGVAVAVVVAACLAACGGQKDGKAAATLPAKPVATSAVRSLTASQIWRRAEAAMNAAPSMVVDWHGAGLHGPLHLTAALAASGKCAATVHTGGDVVQMISTGRDLYMKAAAHFWITQDDANGEAMAAALHGKWLMIPGPETRSSTYALFCSLKSQLSGLSSDFGEGTVSKGRPATLDGRAVVPLVLTTPDATTTVYVAAEGTPYMVKAVKRNGIAPSTTIFSDFGRTVHGTAPSAALTVGIDTVIGDDGSSS